MKMELFKYEKDFYTADEVVENVNKVLGLTPKNYIQVFTIKVWIKQGFIKRPKTWRLIFSKEEYVNILGLAFLNIVLGIKHKNILTTQFSLKQLNSTDKKLETIIKFINLYKYE